jgi:DNA-binding NarL/FixJ family response regulator
VGDRLGSAVALLNLGIVATRQQDYADARAGYEQGLMLFCELDDRLGTAGCLEGLGELAALAGHTHRAARLWGAAEVLREAISAPASPTVRTDFDRVVAAARARGDAPTFVAAWAEGRTMTPEQALATPEPAPIPEAHSSSASPAAPAESVSYPAGLTEREVEVLRLVAQGLTDAQVAEQLVVSPRTVSGHLRSIYSKLQVTSRTAATRFAIEHQLV